MKKTNFDSRSRTRDGRSYCPPRRWPRSAANIGLGHRVRVPRHFPRRLVRLRGRRLHERSGFYLGTWWCRRRVKAPKPISTSAGGRRQRSPTRSATRLPLHSTISTATYNEVNLGIGYGHLRSRRRDRRRRTVSADAGLHVHVGHALARERPVLQVGRSSSDGLRRRLPRGRLHLQLRRAGRFRPR